jgi:hypothetical protein
VLPPELHDRLREVGAVDRIRATVAVPIVLDGEVVATFRLDAFGDPDAFDAAACRTAEVFGDQVAWVLSRWRWEAAAAREARRTASSTPRRSAGRASSRSSTACARPSRAVANSARCCG